MLGSVPLPASHSPCRLQSVPLSPTMTFLCRAQRKDGCGVLVSLRHLSGTGPDVQRKNYACFVYEQTANPTVPSERQ